MNKLHFILILLLLNACSRSVEVENPIRIEVDMRETHGEGNFEEFFSSSSIVPLETNEVSILSGIDRISFQDDKIFILDKRLRSVYIFNNNGKFLNKIQNIGKGPGEYSFLQDFTIDYENHRLLLYSRAPNKIITFNFDGQFIEEKKMTDYYFNIGYQDNKLLSLYKNPEKSKLFQEINLSTFEKKNEINMDKYDHFFFSLGWRTPNIIKSKSLNMSLGYSEIIYGYKNNTFLPKYYIDFGDNETPKNFIEKLDNEFNGLYQYATKNKLGFGISNFRENDSYITFNFWGSMIVIYSKISKKAKIFQSFRGPKDKLIFQNYFAHDGDNNKILSICEAQYFKEQLSIYKKEIKPWHDLPTYIKNIDEKVSSNDNPMLIIYTFKK
ncbi:6-bladed beta-propeller [Hyunsoonleella ulvae]|uniref:6-bladed beta-propeller n=1 Tax=Hyunsoonleella ulvae TaxID=2799948 RepID=UPI00193A7FB9|nr:6-bladed beta-propeller [Hyunsoonleella ulvae]